MSLTKEQEERIKFIKKRYNRGLSNTAEIASWLIPEGSFLLSIIDSLQADLQASLDTPCVV